MSIIRNIMLISLSLCLLTACEKKMTYSYLMRHPRVLMREVENCKMLETKSSDQEAQCETTMYAAANFMSLMNTEREDPEKFGQQIMDKEILFAEARKELQAAKRSLAALQANQASKVEITAAQDRLQKAKQGYEDSLTEVRILLSVVGVNSPE